VSGGESVLNSEDINTILNKAIPNIINKRYVLIG
jgi:hypothetical protein